MSAQAAAVRAALDLMHIPSRVRHMRMVALPDDVGFLLRIAAGDEMAEAEAVDLVSRPLDEIRRAAAFFIEQILLAPESDSYRVLGSSPHASNAEIRRNMALLMRWLHPDRNVEGQQGMFAGRVTSAWDDLKTTDRRLAYDERLSASKMPSSRRKGSRRATSTKPPSRGRKGVPIAHNYKPQAIDLYREGAASLLRRALWRLFGRPQP